MFIEDPEGFKTWLTTKLEPLCEADPAALAKYVYALVKKDKPIEELKSSMVDQLEVFLQKETKGFVELLFKTLESGDFEVKPSAQAETVISANSAPQVPKPPLEDVDLRVVPTPVIPSHPPITAPSSEPSPKKEPTKDPTNVVTTEGSGLTTVPENQNVTVTSLLANRKENISERHPKKIDADDRIRPPRNRGRRGMSMSPPMERSRRSRSYERRRSRSRERDRSRAWRNKSPPIRARYNDRRRSYSKSPLRRHSRSRSPPMKRGRYRNRSPPPRSLTRSLSPSRNSKERILGSPLRRDTDQRLGSSGQTLSSLLALSDKPFGAKRCRDFDEKGFCMRGDLCPFDHGSDPVVLEDLPGSMYNGASQVGPRNTTNPLQLHLPHESPNSLEYNPSAPGMEPRLWRRFYRPDGIRGRGGPMPGGAGGLAVPGAMEGAQFPKRELISVITGSPLAAREPSTPPFRASLPPSRELVMGKRYEPYSRLRGMLRRNAGAGSQGNSGSLQVPSAPPVNNTLQLKKVPTHNNNITQLNEHFSKFGKIVNILVGFEGDPESALITFSCYAEANNAYKSTQPILNNRFIKVFWYTPPQPSANNGVENKQENMVPGGNRPSVMERLGAPNMKVLNSLQPSNVTQQQEARGNSKVIMSNNNISKTIYVPSALKKENTINRILTKDDLVKKKVDEEAIKEVKKKIEAKKEKIKMNAELRKRKQVLLEKQLNQQKLLIERMEGGNIKNEQKTTIMATIKSLQESIEMLKKDLAQDVEASLSSLQTNKKPTPPANPVEVYRKTKEETQRELLDAELDLLKQEQQGKDIVELKKKISDLKVKAFQLKVPILKSSSPPFTSVRGRGATFRSRLISRRGVGGVIRGRGSGRFTYNSLDYNVIDHRPTKLLVSGYEQDDKAEVLAHFNQYGEISNYTSDDATPSLVLNYKSRKEAETALAKGRNFQDRLLSVTWATPNHNIRPGVMTQNTPVTPEEEIGEDVLISGGEDDEIVGLMSPSESLILQDEEEDEDDERTWRR